MNDLLAAAEALVAAGRRDEAIRRLIDGLSAQPAAPGEVWLMLVRQLYFAGRYAEARDWTARGLDRHPSGAELWNIHAVLLQRLRRFAEAMSAIERALALKPDAVPMRVNLGSLLLDMGDAERAAQVFTKLMGAEPANPAHRRLLARALDRLGRTEEAAAQLRAALALRPDHAESRLDLAALQAKDHRFELALETLDIGLAHTADDPRLLEARALALRQSGQLQRTEAYLRDLSARFPDLAWVPFHLGDLISETDRTQAVVHLRRAHELDPDNLDFRIGLVQTLERTQGDGEGENLEEAWALARDALALGGLTPGHAKTLQAAFSRVCAFDELDRLVDFRALGRTWAKAGLHTALLRQLPRVRSLEDRQELLEQHRIWGREVERLAAMAPIRRPPPRPPGGPLRLGFMSSDLRRHVVTHFAQPVFDFIDPARFEVFAYSFYRGAEDPVQARIAAQVSGFRWRPDITARDAAQMIADDQLDMLIELGGSTTMNKLEVMAWRPAPLQASWLGYPHSAGLSAIDHLICDPYNAPPDPSLLAETPLLLPASWIVLGSAYGDGPPIDPVTPQDRTGGITFGTANHPQKYSRELLGAWARIVAGVAGSRFLFIRPEAAAPSFRRHILAAFAAEGVEESRILFSPIRGDHLPAYEQMDISLDSFPLTGGTTTVDALWMGVPVVSLVGPAFFERLSYSILNNAGLDDLCADSLDGYIEIAQALAAAPDRRRALRTTLRPRLRASPLGQPETFARDFYDMVAGVIGATPNPKPKLPPP